VFKTESVSGSAAADEPGLRKRFSTQLLFAIRAEKKRGEAHERAETIC